ncbi:TetR/AcrR family transcriptional regulator [Nitratireductor luteus]|uniref:TetR/AcrR family transcriptional regulator n=1 Tax=Nitratireductor luteus TaxID=2976980 RepID=UPI002240E26D|nr:TetR/AcrR family transcriptional regulator [Nitratireductor luteus]
MVERGRPRAFDRNEALHRAMRLFWTRGYDGTSVSDLAEAMGINKPSLYAAFQCKEKLFYDAVALYEREEGGKFLEALQAGPTAREAVGEALRVNARLFADPQKPGGCMIVVSALATDPDHDAVRCFLSGNRSEAEAAYRKRIERGVAEGDVPAQADAARAAAFYAAIQAGMSVHARDGAGERSLLEIVDGAMAAWDHVVMPGIVDNGRPDETGRS